MNINQDIYESKYHVSCNAGGTYTIDFTDNILTLNREDKLPLGEPMDESNCYCGFDPTKENKIVNPCKYGYIQFNPENVREVNIVSREYRKQINYRLMLSSYSSYGGAPLEFRKIRFTNNITPINTLEYDTINFKLICDSSNYNTFQAKGLYSIPERCYPITDIDYDKLIIVPVFHIFEITFTYTGDVITGATQSASYRRYYIDVKPEDKTPAGTYYDDDLWNNGFKDEFDENNKLIKRTIVTVAYCTINYGKSNRKAFGYGNFNSTDWNSDGNRVLPNLTDTWYAICPMIEYVDDITGSIFYSDIPGLQFPRQDNYSWTNRQELFNFNTNTFKTLSNFGRNTMMNVSATFGYECVVLDNDLNKLDESYTALTYFSTNYNNDFTGHTGLEFFPLEDGSIISANAQNNLTIQSKAYPIKDLMASIASLGILIAADQVTGQTTDIDTFTNTMYRGNMTSDGITDGTWVQGEDIADVPKISEVDYKPLTPGGGGGDENENTGSDIIRPATLGVGGTNGFITQYALTASQIGEIGRLLWLSFANIDYYKNFLFTLTTTGSIDLANLLDYFVSLRVYPFPLINVPSWASAGQDMYIGAGFIPLHFSSTIHTINNYADYIDAGTCEIPRSYGDFRDLTHCEIMLYLPYCGTVQLNPADVVGGTLHAQYAIDFATGGCIAYVDLYTWDGRQFMIAALSGSIGADIPLTATNATQIAARIASNALNVAGTLGNGAAGVAAEVPTIAVGAASGNVPMAAMGAVGALGAEASTAVGLAQDAMRIATQDAVKMPMMAGGRGFAGFGSPQTAYVQIRRGLYAEGHTAPQGFTQAYGNMYAKPVTVDSCTGFTVFANVDTSGLIAQADERDAIRSLMQSGIYI